MHLLLALLPLALASDYPHALAAVPPMGWNSWNCYGGAITADKILSQGQALATSGLRDQGFVYLVMDDGWQGERGGALGAIQGQEAFPDMGALSDQVRALGLRLGIYSTPWAESYQKRTGGQDHEAVDAAQFAAWNVSYLKYDWNPIDVANATRMRDALAMSGRDIVFSLSNNAEMDLGAAWGDLANLWRTTGDIDDSWERMAGIGFSQAGWEVYAGPGHWNDPDMMVLGMVGWGESQHMTRLTPDEQVTHVTLWALLAAPLLLGSDLTRLDAGTLALLTEEDILEIDQDPLGIQASRALVSGDVEVWARPLFTGVLAVGVFNKGEAGTSYTLSWSDLRMSTPTAVRDGWTEEVWSSPDGGVTVAVPAHGARLLLVGEPTPQPPTLVGPLRERAVAGEPFGTTFLAAGSRPFTFAAADLPAGLTLAGPYLSGTPSEAGTFTFPVTVSGEGGASTEDYTLTVEASPAEGDPVIHLFVADALTLVPGQGGTLTWITEGASSVTLEPGVGAVDGSGSVAVDPSVATTYTLTADGISRSLDLEVRTGSVPLGLRVPGRLLPTNDEAEWQGWGDALDDMSIDAHGLAAGGQRFSHGLGVHAPSVVTWDLGGRYAAFEAEVGLDDEVTGPQGSVVFSVWVDGVEVWTSDVLGSTDATQALSVDVTGATTLTLQVDDGGDTLDNDHGDWLAPTLWPVGVSPDTGIPDTGEGPGAQSCPKDGGCGCGAVPRSAPGGWLVWAALALGWRRRGKGARRQPRPRSSR